MARYIVTYTADETELVRSTDERTKLLMMRIEGQFKSLILSVVYPLKSSKCYVTFIKVVSVYAYKANAMMLTEEPKLKHKGLEIITTKVHDNDKGIATLDKIGYDKKKKSSFSLPLTACSHRLCLFH